MNVTALKATFDHGGFHAMNPLRPNPSAPSLAEFPDFYEVGEEIRAQQKFYGRPTLSNKEIAVDDLSDSLRGSAVNLVERAERNRGYAADYQNRVKLGDRARNILGGLSLASLALTPLGGGYTWLGALGAVALGSAAGLTHWGMESQREWQRTYEVAVQEQLGASQHLRELASDLRARQLEWEVSRQTAPPDRDHLNIEVESLEGAVSVGDHVLPVDFLLTV